MFFLLTLLILLIAFIIYNAFSETSKISEYFQDQCKIEDFSLVDNGNGDIRLVITFIENQIPKIDKQFKTIEEVNKFWSDLKKDIPIGDCIIPLKSCKEEISEVSKLIDSAKKSPTRENISEASNRVSQLEKRSHNEPLVTEEECLEILNMKKQVRYLKNSTSDVTRNEDNSDGNIEETSSSSEPSYRASSSVRTYNNVKNISKTQSNAEDTLAEIEKISQDQSKLSDVLARKKEKELLEKLSRSQEELRNIRNKIIDVKNKIQIANSDLKKAQDAVTESENFDDKKTSILRLKQFNNALIRRISELNLVITQYKTNQCKVCPLFTETNPVNIAEVTKMGLGSIVPDTCSKQKVYN